MPNREELINALRRIDNAPNQGDRGISGKIADAAYKAQGYLQGGDPNDPNPVGDFVGEYVLGLPAIARTADNMSRDLPVDAWDAAQVGLTAAPLAKPIMSGAKGLHRLVNGLRKP